MVKYSSTHAYCILAEIKRDIKDKFISIEEDTKNIPGAFTIAKFKVHSFLKFYLFMSAMGNTEKK